MTPRTRSGNGEAEPKVYYSKKVPQQVHFPHKRKTVRRRTSPVQDGSGKRQLVFVPEKMKKQGTPRVVGDSDEESEGGLKDGDVSISPQADKEHSKTRKRKKTGRNCDSEPLQEDGSEKDEPVGPVKKRQRKAAAPKNNRRSRRVQPDSNDDNDGSTKPDRERTLRRQSTMTQLVEGRKPLPGSEGPDFRPVKQGPRLSWSGKGKATKDGKQRTLTQMVSGMRPLEIMSDEDVEDTLSDVEAQEADSHNYRDAVARRLAQQGLYRNDHGDDEEAGENMQPGVETEAQENEEVADAQDVPELVVQSVEDDTNGEGEDSYKPTQFIDAPITTVTHRTTRERAVVPTVKIREASHVQQKAVSFRKARFSLLSTPEKRRVREIPSSQSPADSPLSTQFTPHRLHRSPLKRCTGNEIQAPETPSKRKQVTFRVPSKTPVPPPSLRKFESTIQDSEDEDEGIFEDDASSSGRCVGTETQAMIDQIDQACADAVEESEAEAGLSPELDEVSLLRSLNEASPELGEPQTQSSGRQQRTVPDEDSHPHAELISIKQEPVEDVEVDDLTALHAARSQPPHKGSMESSATIAAEAELPTFTEQLHSTPPIVQDTCPSTPMAIPEDSSDEESTPQPRKQPIQYPPPTQVQQSTDLDGELIQVPRSPTPRRSETQESQTSKAEQQIQSEWFSYSQYVHNARPPQSFSMQAAPDAFSYNATPRPPPTTALNPHQNQHAHRHTATTTHAASQATTIDEITQRTPRKNNTTQHVLSTHTTPHRIASSQPTISPIRPPPLFIPSSFPSPERAGVEGWSSPVLGGATQGAGGGGYGRSSQWGASLEDFSIPLPPPMPLVGSSWGRGNGK
ncbi:hypothetical protein PtrSN002B_002736 [Pyrenophora tritici-repentis]|nr:hypothetical protein PtrSN001C_002680 [Pyrenophora tritici-repentis]KAI1555778.1 hypothetical protein PtrSN002B_002736 [Pyrenophora tritici-repentis]KAI1593523.1 hypothetical protein PtrEW13061_002999 [Pyrenophora tritici-repentis]KAI1605086.1 hypothetical protein PtrCC142_002723 [Pyrenophora tritici-repentis]PWO27996.1 ICln-channel domain containing protein [Pyrenophora tritici-repentis]